MRHHTRRLVYICSFCQKDHRQVARLIAGPRGVYICNECVTDCATQESPRSPASEQTCSFCGNQQAERLWEGKQGVHICGQCITLCEKIINENA